MKLKVCVKCGSTELHEVAGGIFCPFCRSTYAAQKSSTVDLTSDVALLLDKCEVDPKNRARYANLILDIDPTNKQALKYL